MPEFHPIKHGTSDFTVPVAIPEGSSAPQVDLRATTPKRRWVAWKLSPVSIAILVFVAIAVPAIVWRWRLQEDQRAQMWGPLLDSPAPVLFVVGQPHAGQSEIQPAPSVYDQSAPSQLYLTDAIAVAHLSSMLDEHHHLYQIVGVTSTSLSDLRKGPTILVGAFNNPWTLRVLNPLRFSLQSVTTADNGNPWQILEIVDKKNQTGSPWTMDLRQPVSAMTHDYAIIARFQASMTDGVVLVVAGLGAGGTESASKFLNSSTYMRELAAHAPRNWSKMNMEAVLETEVIGGRTGHTHIVATEFW